MKDFPRFTESQITIELKQPHLKIVFAAMQAFLTRFDTEMSPDAFKSLLDDTAKRQGIKFPPELTQNIEAFKTELENANAALMDAYCEKQSAYIDRFVDDVNAFFEEHYDPDVFNLAEGQRLKIDDGVSVYG